MKNVLVPEGGNPLLLDRPTLNPYRFAYRVVRDQIRWDWRRESWRSRRKLRALRDARRGEKAVILCNGPSLNATDLSSLKSVYTFGLNKINLLFDRTDFRPSCIVAVNPFVIQQNKDFYTNTTVPLFIDSAATAELGSHDHIVFIKSTAEPRLARDCSVCIQQGFTVTVVAMQLAYHMGFSSVALVGCDHNFAATGRSNEVVKSGDQDKSHFDPRYFSGGQKWQLPDLLASEYYYKLAREMFEADGRSLVNCTVGGHLEILPRYTLDAWLTGQEVGHG